jgi:hypothetical protein
MPNELRNWVYKNGFETGVYEILAELYPKTKHAALLKQAEEFTNKYFDWIDPKEA